MNRDDRITSEELVMMYNNLAGIGTTLGYNDYSEIWMNSPFKLCVLLELIYNTCHSCKIFFNEIFLELF